MKRYRLFNGKRYRLDAIRPSKSHALGRAKDQKMFWKSSRVVKSGSDWLVYVRGSKRRR